MIRLFVALPMPAATILALRELCSGLPGARWVKPEQFHLTLRFIGEVDGRTARHVADELAGIQMPPFELALHGVGTFGDKRAARSLWAGTRPAAELERLHEKVDGAMARLGLPADRRKFAPHVTLARLNQPPVDRLGAYLSHHALFNAAPFTCDRFVLYSSFLSHGGAIYTPEQVYPLGGNDDHAWMADEAEDWADEDWEHREAARERESWEAERRAFAPAYGFGD